MTKSANTKIRALLILALLAAFPPLSTAMYIPALPSLTTAWHTTETTINLTLVGFFVSFSLAMLVYGPLSDRYGRKPVLLAGIYIYILASLVCSLANSPWILVLGRIMQGMGAASAATLSLAMTKDIFEGAEREHAMAHIAVIVSLAPMLAPVLGSIMLSFTSWRAIFHSQMLLGALSIWGVWRLKEPTSNTSRSLGQVLSNYKKLICNLRFMTLCALIALGMTPLFCFTGGSAFIFINQFGLSEQEYSYFYAFNSASLMLGFWICGRLLKRLPAFRIIMIGYGIALVSAIVLVLCSGFGLWGMAVPMACMTAGVGLTRPPSNNFLLEQIPEHTGPAASVIMFTFFVGGAAAMWFIALPWDNKVLTLALVGVTSSAFVLAALPKLKRPKTSSPDSPSNLSVKLIHMK